MKQFKFAFVLMLLSGVIFSGALEAGQYDLKEMTPEISAAIKSRQARFTELENLKARNQVGENNRGYVSVLSGDAAAVVENENRDRAVIYRAIADQNGLGATGMQVIETVFAEVQREKAGSGESIQLPGGEWVKK